MTYLPNMQVTGDGMSVSFDVTPMVHDLTRRVIKRVEEGAVGEVVAFLAENGHLADVIRKAKAQAWDEGHGEPKSCCGLCPRDYCPWDNGGNGPKNPYMEES